MRDPRFEQLAQVLIRHSVKLQAGENILIDATDVPETLIIALIRAAQDAGGNPMVNLKQGPVTRALLQGATEESMKLNGASALVQMQSAQCSITIGGPMNTAEMSDVPGERMKLFMQHWRHPVVLEHQVKHTRWCALRYPLAGMAQAAQMSTEAFEDFFFQVCTFDYSRMEKAVAPLQELMEKTDRVRILGPGTDLRFSIQGIGVIPCNGTHNIPDGECFTAPVRDSVQGTIQYNTPTIQHGVTFENVRLTFENGKVVLASSSNTEKLNEILDTDEGARYIGEFALGYNPYILNPMKDILFDEKIAGSFHFTPGQAYQDADNGNRSEVHWDMICIQRPEFGGGEIYFDDVLIRKDGLFTLPELQALNPENLKATAPVG